MEPIPAIYFIDPASNRRFAAGDSNEAHFGTISPFVSYFNTVSHLKCPQKIFSGDGEHFNFENMKNTVLNDVWSL